MKKIELTETDMEYPESCGNTKKGSTYGITSHKEGNRPEYYF